MRRKIKRRGREFLFRNLKSYRSAKARSSVFLNLAPELRSFVFRASSREVVYVSAKFSAVEIHLGTRNCFKERSRDFWRSFEISLWIFNYSKDLRYLVN